jgi:hypothetical protein
MSTHGSASTCSLSDKSSGTGTYSPCPIRRNQPCCFHRDRSFAAARRSMPSASDARSTDTTSLAARSTVASLARWVGSELFPITTQRYIKFAIYANCMYRNIVLARPEATRTNYLTVRTGRADLPQPALREDSRDRRGHCMGRLQLLKTTWELSGLSPISLPVVASCVSLQLRGPFPPPELPGFVGTTSLSAIPVSPARLSRAAS